MERSHVQGLVGSAVAVVVLAGCAGTQDQAATSAAQDLLSAVADQDGDAACALAMAATTNGLAPRCFSASTVALAMAR